MATRESRQKQFQRQQALSNQLINEMFQPFMSQMIVPPLSKTVPLDVSNRTNTAIDTNTDALSKASGTFGTIFGGPIGGAIGSMAGNLLGQAVNYTANSALQENQIENQMELQNRAYNLNQQAVQNQAQNEVIGMQKAGLNPAGVNGAGAPSLQAGAAAGGNSTMSNIFSGLAEIISAIKAPTEIDKIKAEKELTEATTGKTQAETGVATAETKSILEGQIPQLQSLANKYAEEAQNVKNANELYKQTQDFAKEYGSSIFETYRSQLKATGQWNNLSPKTRNTIDNLADGQADGLNLGEIEGLNKMIDTTMNISSSDNKLLHNTLDAVVTGKQLLTKETIDKLADLPNKQYDHVIASTSHIWADVARIQTLIPNILMDTSLKMTDQRRIDADKALKEAQKLNEDVNRKIKELENVKYQLSKGNYKGAAVAALDHIIEHTKELQKTTIGSIGGLVGGIIGGKIGAGGKIEIPNIDGLMGNTPPKSNPNFNSNTKNYYYPTSAKYPTYGQSDNFEGYQGNNEYYK